MNKEIEELLNKIKQQFIIDEKFAKDFHKTTLNYEETKLLLSYIEQLENLCNKYEQEHKTTFEIWKKDIKKLKQLEKEYKQLKDRNEINIDRNIEAYRIVKQLESNRDKAIEYIHNYFVLGADSEFVNKLEIILKGDSDGNL